ncbi:Tex9 [Symbiodinium sp. CCMP2456]|nr:Tex9 [Symbiodinium sp. CCMP2456]
MVMAQLVGLRMGAVSRAFRAMGTPSDYSFTYSFYLRCCGLHAQHEQLARGSWRNSGVFRAFFLGKKVEWKGKVRWSQQTVTADTVSVHMKLHEHVYGEPLLLMAAPGMLARGPALSPGAWILPLGGISTRQPLQFTEEEHGPASDSETDTAPETEEVESSSGDERWNRRVESDASVPPSPTTVVASEEAKRKADGSPETDSDRVCVICQGLLALGARSEPENSRELDRALSELSQRETEEKLKKQLATLETKAKDLEVERSELTKERDQLDLKLRKAEAECSSKEARLNRLMEESDKWKRVRLRTCPKKPKPMLGPCRQAAAATANVQDAERREERDRVASDRKEVDRLTGEINAFKKQMKLIEVLKRQRAHMEAARVLSFTEDPLGKHAVWVACRPSVPAGQEKERIAQSDSMVEDGQCTAAGVMGSGRVFVVTGSSFLLGGWICLCKLAVAADTCSVPCPEDWPPPVPQTAPKVKTVKRVPAAWQPPAAGEYLPFTPAGVLGSPKAVEVERQIYTLLGGRLARENAIPTPETRVIAAVWPGNFVCAYPTADGGLIALLSFESNPERDNGALVLLPKTTLSAGGGKPRRLKSFPADVFAGNFFVKSCNSSILLLCQFNSKLYPVDDWDSPHSFGIIRVMQASEFGLHWFKNFTVEPNMALTAMTSWGECGVALSFHMWPKAPPKGRIPVFMLLDEGLTLPELLSACGERWLHIDSEIFSSNMAEVTYLVEVDGGLAGTNQTALLFISGQDITRDAGLTFAWKMNVTYLLKLSDGALLVCGSGTLSVFEPGAVARLEQPKPVAAKFTADIIAATESADSDSVVILLATGVAVTLSRLGWNPRRSDSVGSARTGHGALASLGDSTFAVAYATGLRLLKLSQHGATLPVMFPELGERIHRIHSLDEGVAVSTANNWVYTYRPADLKAVGLPSKKPFKIFSDGYPITILEVSEDIWVAHVFTMGKTSFTIQLYDFGASVYPWCNLTPPIYDRTFYAMNWGYQMARGTIVAKDGNVVVLGASGYVWIDHDRMKFSSGSKCLLGEPGYHMSHFAKNPFTGFADLGGRVVLSVTSWKEPPCACFKDEGSWRGGAAIYEESNLSSGGWPYLRVGHHETTGALPLRTGGFLLTTGQGLEFYGPKATLRGGEPEATLPFYFGSSSFVVDTWPGGQDLYLPGVVPLSWKPALVVAGSVLVAQPVPEGRYSPDGQPMALTCPNGWTSPAGSGSCPVHTWALVNTAPVLLAALCVAVGCCARRWQRLLHRTEACFALLAACLSPDQVSSWCCLGHVLVTFWGWRHDAGAAVLHAMAVPMLAAALHAAWLQALAFRHGGAFQDRGCHEVLTPFGHRVCETKLGPAIAFVAIACAALAGLILAGSAAGRASTTRWVEASATRSTPLRAAVAIFTTWRGKQLIAAGNALISFCIFLHTHLSLGETDPLRAITSVCTSLGLLSVVCGVVNAAAWQGRLPLWPEDTHFRVTIVQKHVLVAMKLCMLTSKHQTPLGPELEHLWQCRLPSDLAFVFRSKNSKATAALQLLNAAVPPAGSVS